MDKIKILEELGGLSEEVYDQLCVLFIDDAKIKIAELKTAIQILNYDQIKLLAHSIKGASGNLRIIHIQATAQQLEQAAINHNPKNQLQILISSLEQDIENFKI